MSSPPLPIAPATPRHVLIVGGGVAGVEALMALASGSAWQLRIHMLAASDRFQLRPQMVGAPWGGPPLSIELDRICRAFGATFEQASIAVVDPDRHVVVTSAGRELPYDKLLLATGARSSVPYTGSRVVGFGALPTALATGRPRSLAVVVPPGTTWTLPAYELALLAATGAVRRVEVHSPEDAPLEVFGPGALLSVERLLDEHGVRVHVRQAVPVGEDLRDLADLVVALPALRGPGVAGLPAGHDGFVPVDARMAVRGAPRVHAAGDMTDHAIKQGGLAAQQAETAAADILRGCGLEAADVPYAPILRGKLTLPGRTALYLRRVLDEDDPGLADTEPLWRPEGVICAPRLSTWLNRRSGPLDELSVDHVARPPRPRQEA